MLELGDGDRERAGNVPRAELLLGPDVDHGDVAPSDPPTQLVEADRLHLVTLVDVQPGDLLDLGEPAAGE